MNAKVKAIPDGYHAITPYLHLRRAAEAIEFYKKAFGAKECVRMPGPNGQIMHAELQIGDSMIMLADESPEMGARGPETIGGTSFTIALYVENVDAVYAQAIHAGAKQMRPLENQFYGDRAGSVLDPFGHQWHIATHVEDVPPEEMERRAAECMKKAPPQ
ncbi:MAG: VOC family protein [Verrucomicrobiales bacterium]|nr:VOC family protein [Verrucomicrobiales bacterium]